MFVVLWYTPTFSMRVGPIPSYNRRQAGIVERLRHECFLLYFNRVRKYNTLLKVYQWHYVALYNLIQIRC